MLIYFFNESLLKIRFLILLNLLTTLTFSQVINYNWPATIPVSDKYSVNITQGVTGYNVHTHYSEPNLLQGPDGDGVTGFLEDRSMSFAAFSFTGSVTVEVKKLYGVSATRVEIQPKSYGINPFYFDGRTVKFTLTHRDDNMPLYISIHFHSEDNRDEDGTGGYDIKNGILIFADQPETNAPSKSAPGVVIYSNTANISTADIIYFEPGDYNLKQRFTDGVLRLRKNNQRVYISGGAYIRGAIHGEGYDGTWIYGRGIITGKDMYWHEIVDENGVKEAFLNFMGSNDSMFEGFILHNPTHHSLPSSQRSGIRNIKIIGWASNHDGIRPSGGSSVEQVFIKTSDDNDYARDQHTFRNSVIWPMRNGAFGQLGWNDLGTGYTNYRNICFINSEWVDINKRNTGVIGSVLQQGANIAFDTVENVYCENNQIVLAHLTLVRDPADPFDPSDPGEIHYFTFRNIIFEKPFQGSNGNLNRNPVKGFEYNGVKATVHDINFVNLVLGNTLVTQSNYTDFFDVDPSTTYNISFSQEGNIHCVQADSGPGGTVSPSGTLPTPAGMTRTIDIIPDPGFRIKSVVIDGTELTGRNQHVCFKNITSDHSVSVTFEPGSDYFDFTSAAGTGTILYDEISIFPNPADEKITVEGVGDECMIELYSPAGNFLRGSAGRSLDLTGLASGIYVVSVNRTNRFKLIKK